MAVQTPTQQRVLFVQEEYGYRHWIGVLPDEMTTESVIEWWKALEEVGGMFFNPSKSFPMDLYELKDVAPEDADMAIMQWVDSKGVTHTLNRDHVVLFAHTHEEGDSYLKIPKGETFHHAGRVDEWDEDKEVGEEYSPPLTAEEIEEMRIKS